MHDPQSCVASETTQPLRRQPRRMPVREERSSPVNPQLFVVALSLGLWTAIIGACTIVVR